MPTIKSMIEEFTESSRYSYYYKNIIKSNKKEILEQQIRESKESSFAKVKKLNDKAQAKEIYEDLVDYLNNKYEFNIDIDEVLN